VFVVELHVAEHVVQVLQVLFIVVVGVGGVDAERGFIQ